MGLTLSKNDLREKASDAETIRKAWKNWDQMFENDQLESSTNKIHEVNSKSDSTSQEKNGSIKIERVFNGKSQAR